LSPFRLLRTPVLWNLGFPSQFVDPISSLLGNGLFSLPPLPLLVRSCSASRVSSSPFRNSGSPCERPATDPNVLCTERPPPILYLSIASPSLLRSLYYLRELLHPPKSASSVFFDIDSPVLFLHMIKYGLGVHRVQGEFSPQEDHELPGQSIATFSQRRGSPPVATGSCGRCLPRCGKGPMTEGANPSLVVRLTRAAIAVPADTRLGVGVEPPTKGIPP